MNVKTKFLTTVQFLNTIKKDIDKSSLAKGALISTISVTIFSVLVSPLLIELGIAILITTLVRKKVLENEEVMQIIKCRLFEFMQYSVGQYDEAVNQISFSFKEISGSNYTSKLNDVKDQSLRYMTDMINVIPKKISKKQGYVFLHG